MMHTSFKVGLLAVGLLAPVGAWATCTPSNAPVGSLGCMPNLNPAQSTDILYGWRAGNWPNPDSSFSIGNILNVPGSTQYFPYSGGALIGPISLGGGLRLATKTVTTSYITLASDTNICVNDSVTAPTITLGNGFPAGTPQTITDCGLNAANENITITASGGISGFTNVLFNQNGTSQSFLYTGSAWIMQ